uniref:Ig-like domain-containing protein n=1 Tax=Daphnia galeata TaxID=27404 RepID=A0A8J2WTW8_9CRUS|nr:unnamed protein product [Daphnia galeata]
MQSCVHLQLLLVFSVHNLELIGRRLASSFPLVTHLCLAYWFFLMTKSAELQFCHHTRCTIRNGALGTDVIQLTGPLQHVVSVVKGKTNLPCDITPPVEDDQASLVLFYKDDASPSIYTYDARDKYANRPRHWSDENVLGKRAFFSTVLMQNNYSSSGCLMIDNVRESDAGLYRCRVDFKRSPTRNSRVNLTVVGKYLSFSSFLFSSSYIYIPFQTKQTFHLILFLFFLPSVVVVFLFLIVLEHAFFL